MKRLVLFLLFLFFREWSTTAQTLPDQSAAGSEHSVYDLKSIELRTMTLLEKYYKTNQDDSLDFAINYYETHVPRGGLVFPVVMIRDIREQVFREELRNTISFDTANGRLYNNQEYYELFIIEYLLWYKAYVNAAVPDETQKQLIGAYYSFVRQIAAEQLADVALFPDERFLLTYFAHPSDSLLYTLSAPVYKGALLQKSWKNYVQQCNSATRTSMGIAVGSWTPTGSLSKLGTHLKFGLDFTGYKLHCLYAINFGIIGAGTNSRYVVEIKDTPRTTNFVSGVFYDFDFGYVLFAGHRHNINLTGNIGYSILQPFADASGIYSNITINSLTAGFALDYHYFFPGKSRASHQQPPSLEFRVGYNFCNFLNPGGTALAGDVYTLDIIYRLMLANKNRKHRHY